MSQKKSPDQSKEEGIQEPEKKEDDTPVSSDVAEYADAFKAYANPESEEAKDEKDELDVDEEKLKAEKEEADAKAKAEAEAAEAAQKEGSGSLPVEEPTDWKKQAEEMRLRVEALEAEKQGRDAAAKVKQEVEAQTEKAAEAGKKVSFKDILAKAEKKLSPEEKEAYDFYRSELDTVATQTDKRLEALFDGIMEVLDERLAGVTSTIDEKTKPLKEIEAEMDKATHFDVVRKAHPDLDTLRDNGSLASWIKSKPTSIQKMYLNICDQGSSQEVIDMLTEMKQDPKYVTPAQAPEKKEGSMAVHGRNPAVNSRTKLAEKEGNESYEDAFKYYANKK